MNKIVAKGIKGISKIAKQVAENSTNSVSSFLYYEPKAPQEIKKKVKKEN